MQVIRIEVEEGGRLRLPPQAFVPADARLAVLLVDGPAAGSDEPAVAEVARLAEQSGALDFLAAEPELYTDADLEAGQRNPDFGGNATSR
jgi:hypothetical protein